MTSPAACVLGLCMALILSVPQVLAQTAPPPGGGGTATFAPSGGDGGSDDRDSNASAGPRRPANAATVPGTLRPEYVTVGPIAEAQRTAQALTAAGARVIRTRVFPALGRQLLVVDLQGTAFSTALRTVEANAPGTQFDVQHLYRFAQGTPRLYAAALVGASPQGCRGPVAPVGMIDGPVQTGHPALAAADVRSASFLLRRDRAVSQDHGTAVAALLVGEDPQGALNGFARGAPLLAAGAFARESGGPAADVERVGAALNWLVGSGVSLVNMSFAGPVNVALEDLMIQAARRGTVLIAAAGNDGADTVGFPAASGAVIAVTAIDARGRLYRRANTGVDIEFSAPGVDLYVAQADGAGYASGTSYAAPIITGLAAQLRARGPLTTASLRQRLQAQTRDLGRPGRDLEYGWGLVVAPDC